MSTKSNNYLAIEQFVKPLVQDLSDLAGCVFIEKINEKDGISVHKKH